MIINIIKYQFLDMIKNRWTILLGLALFLMASGLFRLHESYEKTFVSLLNIVIILVPLVCLAFGILVYYNSGEYILFLLVQPIERLHIYIGLTLGIMLPMLLALFFGLGVPMMLFAEFSAKYLISSAIMLLVAVLSSSIFISQAFLIAVYTEDKTKALGVAIFTWITFAILYDGLVLLAAINFSDYPLELPMLILSAFNPVDLGRLIVLLNLDIATLMGYSGRLYQNYLGNHIGITVSFLLLGVWASVPFLLGLRKFRKKDF
ncbi:MAG: ABC transporter permease subunit [Ignavibacteriales bacterium]|nr:ABC transporter permease subunit [Ignavibacteriales bacterium]